MAKTNEILFVLPSGKRKSLAVPESSNVRDLQVFARECFGQRFLKLATANGDVLADPMEPLHGGGVRAGDHLTVIRCHKNHSFQRHQAHLCSGALETTT